ncbi:hypothetical protein NPIL_116431, partial [Nephila pilipes]
VESLWHGDGVLVGGISGTECKQRGDLIVTDVVLVQDQPMLLQLPTDLAFSSPTFP